MKVRGPNVCSAAIPGGGKEIQVHNPPFSSLVYFLQNAKESRQFLSEGAVEDHVHPVLHVAATEEYGKSGRLKCQSTFFYTGISRVGTFFANAANAANAANTRRKALLSRRGKGELRALPKIVLAKAYQGLRLLRATGFLDRSDRFTHTRVWYSLSEA